MKKQNETPLFAHLQYKVLKQFGLSPAEYWYLDMVYYLSRSGWCYKSLENIARDMNMTKNGVIKLRDRLTSKGLIVKGYKGRVKSSVTYNKVYLTDSEPYNLVTNRTTKYTSAVPLSSTKINIKNNKDKVIDLNKNKKSLSEMYKDHLKAKSQRLV